MLRREGGREEIEQGFFLGEAWIFHWQEKNQPNETVNIVKMYTPERKKETAILEITC